MGSEASMSTTRAFPVMEVEPWAPTQEVTFNLLTFCQIFLVADVLDFQLPQFFVKSSWWPMFLTACWSASSCSHPGWERRCSGTNYGWFSRWSSHDSWYLHITQTFHKNGWSSLTRTTWKLVQWGEAQWPKWCMMHTRSQRKFLNLNLPFQWRCFQYGGPRSEKRWVNCKAVFFQTDTDTP